MEEPQCKWYAGTKAVHGYRRQAVELCAALRPGDTVGARCGLDSQRALTHRGGESRVGTARLGCERDTLSAVAQPGRLIAAAVLLEVEHWFQPVVGLP